MENRELEKYTGSPEMTIVEAMQKIDVTGSGILFIVDEQMHLTGTLTDGDIRRWLIKTGNLKTDISEIMQSTPHFLLEAHREQALEIIIKNQLRALPIIDKEHKIVDIIFNAYRKSQGDHEISQALKDIPVVIMAGGKGTRLLPYTSILPKPLIPVGEKTILERIIEQFCRFGCEQFYIILNYKKNMIKAYFNEFEHNYHLFYIDEEEPLGTGGGLVLLKDKLKGSFILSNCDILINENFSNIYDYHKKNGNKVSMICSLRNFNIPYGIVHTGSKGIVESMEEKPAISFLANTGCYIVDSEILNEIPIGIPTDFPDILNIYREKGNQIGVYPISESAWLDMGQIDELEKMKKSFEEL